MAIFDNRKVAASVRTDEDFREALTSDVEVIFMQNFVKLMGADGILTTKTGMIRSARDIGLITVQRFFIVDSHSVDTAVDSIKIAKPDVVEIMPGVVEKKIKEFAEKVDTPILAGGLIEFEEEVDNAIDAGAKAVSTANKKLWNYK